MGEAVEDVGFGHQARLEAPVAEDGDEDATTADDHITALVPYARSIFGLTASGTLFRLAP